MEGESVNIANVILPTNIASLGPGYDVMCLAWHLKSYNLIGLHSTL